MTVLTGTFVNNLLQVVETLVSLRNVLLAISAVRSGRSGLPDTSTCQQLANRLGRGQDVALGL